MTAIDDVKHKYAAFGSILSERASRLWAAAEALAMGKGGVTVVSRATGLSRTTIYAGLREIGERKQSRSGDGGSEESKERSRRSGGGRKPLTEHDVTLAHDLESAVESTTRGDPQSPLRWTCKSVRELAAHLNRREHRASPSTIARLLDRAGYNLHVNRKTKEGDSHSDRDAQFEYINKQVKAFQRRGQPVISVDTKKKEIVGNFKNGGREWQRKDQHTDVGVHDFAKKKAIPYGVYDLSRNAGWVSVGIDHDTPEFAVATIRQWWQSMGLLAYPAASELLITADGGGSNGSRARLWKAELQRLANDTHLRISVCHLPPGTSKWNKIEHRMFCHITRNWRARPLESHAIVVKLIGATKTRAGLSVQAKLDKRKYPTGIKVPDDEMARLNIERAKFHGKWNYAVSPAPEAHSAGTVF
jgi:Rhodopirellula transposase DDE domain